MVSNVLTDIRRNLELHIGEKVWLKANRGRRKTLVREGILESTYPYHFLVRMVESSSVSCVSISYADVLTKTVELCIGGPDQKLISGK
ncbi:MAG: Veg family protein [bacterium]|nr:Veg family protein [bacterium]